MIKFKYSVVFIITILLLVGIISAETTKEYDPETEKIQIKVDGVKTIEFELIYNTYFCGKNCEAVIMINNSVGNIEDMIRNIAIEKKNVLGWEEHQIQSLEYYYLDGGSISEGNWVLYDRDNLNKVIKNKGVHFVKIEGTKDQEESLDWILNILQDIALNEWALWGEAIIYDEIDDASVNGTLWTATKSGIGNYQEGVDTLDVTCNTGGVASGSAQVTSKILNVTNLYNLTTSIRGRDLGDNGRAYFRIFGTEVYEFGPTEQTILFQIIRNVSAGANKYDVFENGGFNEQITATDDELIINCSITNTADTTISVRMHYVYYQQQSESVSITLNTPGTNQGYLPNASVIFNSTMDYFYGGINNATLYIDGVKNGTVVLGGGTSEEAIFTRSYPSIGEYNWSITACSNVSGNCNNSETRTFFIYDSVQFNFNNGAIVPSCEISNGSITATNLWNLMTGDTTAELTCSLSNYAPGSWTVRNNVSVQNLTMNPYYINLSFFDYDGSSQNVYGFVLDSDSGGGISNFTGSEYYSLTANLSENYIYIRFGIEADVDNGTQFYEFENTGSFLIENLTVMSNPEDKVYIKVVSDSGDPVDDVLIRASYERPDNSEDNWKEIGMRFTGTEKQGQTFFYFEEDSTVILRASKDGFTAVDTIIDVNQLEGSGTSDNPVIIRLKRSYNVMFDDVMFSFCEYYNNLTEEIEVSVYAPYRTGNFQVNTSYNGNLTNFNYYSLFKNGNAILSRDVHYCSDCTDDLILYLYIDGTLFGEYTIPYKTFADDINVSPSGLDNDVLYQILWIMLIVIIGVLGLIFKSGEEGIGSGSMGKGLFIIGILIIPLLFGSAYIYLFIVPVIYGMGIILKKWISE